MTARYGGWLWSKLVSTALVPGTGCRSKRSARSATGQCSWPSLFLQYTSEHFSILENKLIGYADDSTFMAVVPYPGVRATVGGHYP